MGHEHVAKTLLDGKYDGCGATVDLRDLNGWTPLIFASAQGREAVVRVLLARGADVATRTNRGKSALSVASNPRTFLSAASRAAIKALLKAHGAESDEEEGDEDEDDEDEGEEGDGE